MSTPTPILTLNNIEVIYDKVALAIKGVSVEVPQGGMVALLGANGAGKSTTLKSISGLLQPERGEVTRGDIRFMGQDIAGLAPQARVKRGIVQVLEGRRVFEHLTPDENLVAASAVVGGSRADLARGRDMVYGYFPRLHQRRTAQSGFLSGGEQQMLAIGRALIAQPQLILLDEPSLGLSPKLVEDIFTIIARINAERGTSMLLVEQNATVALAVAHRGYIMENGKIVIDGTAERLANDPDVREFYLGMGGGGEAKSFKDIKHYKRRKRWLS